MPRLPGSFRLAPAVLASVVLVATLLSALAARAHSVGLSHGTYRLSGDTLAVELIFQNAEFASLLTTADTNHDARLDAAELSVPLDLSALTIDARTETGACAGAMTAIHLVDADGVAAEGRFSCPAGGHEATIRLDFLDALSFGHRHVATTNGASEASEVLYGVNRTLRLAVGAAPALAQTGEANLFRLGVEHVLTGYDHLVFLLGLVLVRSRVRTLVGIITAFTVGHSISLGLSAFGVAVPSPSLVEPAIALSIAYIGAENFFVQDVTKRYRLTAIFGLVHGFGFAGVLHELALPASQVPWVLFTFNAGVEVGQLTAMVPVLLLLHWLRGNASGAPSWFDTHGVRAISGSIVVAGLTWFVLRVIG